MHYENINIQLVTPIVQSDNANHAFHLLLNIINDKERKTSKIIETIRNYSGKA